MQHHTAREILECVDRRQTMQQRSNIDFNVLFAEGWNQIYQDYNPRTAFRHASCDLAAICAFRTTVMYLISVLGDQGI